MFKYGNEDIAFSLCSTYNINFEPALPSYKL